MESWVMINEVHSYYIIFLTTYEVITILLLLMKIFFEINGLT